LGAPDASLPRRSAFEAIEGEWAELLGATALKRIRTALLRVSDELGSPEYL
jgi:hypothetical protein